MRKCVECTRVHVYVFFIHLRCLKEYDDRVNSQLHTALELTPTPSTSSESDQHVESQSHVSQFKQELRSLLEESSERKLSQLPLVGLMEAGPVSRLSMQAFSAIQRVKLKAASRMGKAKSQVVTEVHSKWTLMVSNLRANAKGQSPMSHSDDKVEGDGDGVDVCSPEPPEDINSAVEVLEKADDPMDISGTNSVPSEETLFVEAALSYYGEHSKRHMSELPLVGLRRTGRAYTFSQRIASWGRRVLAEASHLQNQVSLLTHLGYTLFDVPMLTSPPLPVWMEAGMLDHGLEELAASPLPGLLLRICRRGQSLMNSSQDLLAAFDTMLGHEVELDFLRQGNQEEGHIWRQNRMIEPASCNALKSHEAGAQDSISRPQQATEEYGKPVTTGMLSISESWLHVHCMFSALDKLGRAIYDLPSVYGQDVKLSITGQYLKYCVYMYMFMYM